MKTRQEVLLGLLLLGLLAIAAAWLAVSWNLYFEHFPAAAWWTFFFK